MRKYRLPDSRQDGISPKGRGNRSSPLNFLRNTLTFVLLTPHLPKQHNLIKNTGQRPLPLGEGWGEGRLIALTDKPYVFCLYFNHFYTFFTLGPAIFSSSFYCPPYTQAIKNNTSGGVP